MECVVYRQSSSFLVPPSVGALETAWCSDPTQTNSAPVDNNSHVSGIGEETAAFLKILKNKRREKRQNTKT